MDMNLYPKIKGKSLHTTFLFVNYPTVKAQKKVTFQILLMAVWARKAVLSPKGSIEGEIKPQVPHTCC